jgi:iron complex outermembrane receptor protein
VLAAPTRGQQAEQGQSPDVKKAEEEGKVRLKEEVVVVSASKTESTLINAPATMSVVSADTIATSPAQNYGDLLRSVPGLNVIQTSARDINITARQATSTLANSQLVLLDGRSIYLDFFGLVLWDFVPQSPDEIKQIEVVRGPASAVWGANALTGVVNIITKPPREAEGFGLSLNGGLLNRDAGSRQVEGTGYSYGGNFSYAHAPSENLAFRLSAGYFNSDPYSRPLGRVPTIPNPFLDPSVSVDCNVPLGSRVPAGCVGGGVYPPDQPGLASYVNRGTSQPKTDLRVDQDFSNGGRMTYQGGYAGTQGIIHTGIGPFNIQSGSKLIYGKLQYTKGALRITSFGNFTDAQAPNELAVAPNGQPVQLNFTTHTYDLEVGNTNVLGTKHIVSYGGNYRRNNFDITLAPNSEDRNEFGLYLQEEFYLDKFRLAAGVRMDKFGNLSDPFFSPRVSVMFKPAKDQSLRVSFNRAFRSPSVINNFLDQAILAPPPPVDLRPLGPFLPPPLRPFVATPFFLAVKNVGNPNLDAHSLNAYELAYTGAVNHGKTTLGFAVYQNDENKDINFTNLLSLPVPIAVQNGLTFYDTGNPATGVTVTGQPITLPPVLMGIMANIPPQLGGPIRLPETVSTYLNLGKLRHHGVEASIDHQFSRDISAFVNYSYQDEPKPIDNGSVTCPTTLVPGALIPTPLDCYPVTEIGIAPKNRLNAGVNVSTKRFLGSVSVNFTDKAYWQDVLAPDYAGYTDSFTMVNAAFGVRWADGKLTTSIKGTNLFNETIQQQVYGDILKRALVLEVRLFTK